MVIKKVEIACYNTAGRHESDKDETFLKDSTSSEKWQELLDLQVRDNCRWGRVNHVRDNGDTRTICVTKDN